MAEITGPKEGRASDPNASPFKSQVWRLQNRDVSWRPTVKLSQAVALIAVAMLDVLSLPAQIHTASGPRYKAFDLQNVFLFYPFQKEE